jgi:RNA recognition motif-containing protein
MGKKLYVGNLPFSINNDKLKEVFAAYNVESAEVVLYKDGRSKGFGFVTVAEDMSEKAKTEMNGKEVEGRTLTVNDAVPFDPNKPKREFRPRRSFGGGGRRFDREERY